MTDEPIDPSRLEYRDRRERTAFDLLARRDAVKIVSENRIPKAGLELTGRVVVAEDRREYRPQILLSDEGQAAKAECTCAFFRKQGTEGRALRPPDRAPPGLRGAGGPPKLQGADPNRTITVETRSFSRRSEAGEEVYQVSAGASTAQDPLGPRRPAFARLQTFAFDSDEAASAAYLARVSGLESRGFLDATAG